MASSGQTNAATGRYGSAAEATAAQQRINEQIRANRMANRSAVQDRQAGEARVKLQASLAKDDLAYRDSLNRQAEDRRLAQIQSLMGNGGPATGSSGSSVGGGSGQAKVAAAEEAARNAAFARAKEQSAAVARSSLAGLRSNLASRGISGGGYADMRTAEALAPAADRLQDFTREQLIQDLGRAEEVSDRDVAADLTRRGQDISRNNALLGLLQASRLY